MAAAKQKQFLITDVNGEWYVGPVQAIDAVEAVISFEKNQSATGKLDRDLVGTDYDVYELASDKPTALKAVVGITKR